MSVVATFNITWFVIFDRYYDGDQEKLFNEAHVVSPHRKELFVKKVIDFNSV